MNEEIGTSLKPPYLSYTTFSNFLMSLKAGVIPSRIDKTLMPGHSGAIQSYLIAAMKFFRLIDDKGSPLPMLSDLVEADESTAKHKLRSLVQACYGPIIDGLDLERATPGQLREKFAAQGLNGDTIRKCEAFFTAAADAAGIPLAANLKPKARNSGPRRNRKSKTVAASPANIPAAPIVSEIGANGDPVAILFLNGDGSRKVVLCAPSTITKIELDRIQKWVSFQLIVED